MKVAVDAPQGPQGAATVAQQDRLFHGFLEAAPDAVVIVDGDGVIAQVNGRTEEVFGYRRDELVGRRLELLMPERYRGAHVAEARSYVANPRARTMGRGLALFGLRKSGDEFPIDVSISPLPPEKGLLVASIIRDMTSHRRLEEELRQRSLALEEADRQKDNFLSAVAHELRSPLGVLKLVADILRSPRADAAIREEALDRLERQTAHMARLIEDLLDLARVRAGTLTLHRKTVDMRAVFVDAVEMVKPIVENRRHLLEVAPVAQPLRVNGDHLRLVQVVSNLLTNAAKYTPEGGHIWCSAAREDGSVVVRVRDNGVGIPKEMLRRVFEPFAQVNPTEQSSGGGLGIGLALVWRLVQLHAGTVEATSGGPGAGSEFVVRLPLLPGGGDAGPSPVSS